MSTRTPLLVLSLCRNARWETDITPSLALGRSTCTRGGAMTPNHSPVHLGNAEISIIGLACAQERRHQKDG
jgi:hypothetical protein